MQAKAAERWLHTILLSVALLLCLLRFAFLRADFPNHSPWMLDQAKFTDEGWWASAAVRHFLIGHWQVEGDYNPAAAVPAYLGCCIARRVETYFLGATVGTLG